MHAGKPLREFEAKGRLAHTKFDDGYIYIFCLAVIHIVFSSRGDFIGFLKPVITLSISDSVYILGFVKTQYVADTEAMARRCALGGRTSFLRAVTAPFIIEML